MLTKIKSEHLIQEYGFIPMEFEAQFRPNVHLDHYEEKVGKAKIVGFVGKRIILDVRDNPEIPFFYMYTYIDKFGESVYEEVHKTELAARLKAEEERVAREEAEAAIPPEEKERRRKRIVLEAELNLLRGRQNLRPFGSQYNDMEEVIAKRIKDTEEKLRNL